MPLQIRRAANATERLGTTAQPFVPLVGEQILQIDNDIMYMGDGSTRGGVATTFSPYAAGGTYAQGDVVVVSAADSTTIYRYISPHLKSAGAFNASEVDTDNNAIWSSVAGGGGGLTVRHLGLTTMNVLADELITDNERLWLMMENQTNRSLSAPPTDNVSLLLSGGDVLPMLSDPTTAGDYVRRVGTAPVAYPTDDIPTTFSPTVGATRSPTIHRENATTFAMQFNQTAANQPSAANLLTYFPMGSTFYIPAANLRDFQGQTLSPAPYAIRGTVNGAPTVVPGGEGYVVRVPVTGVNDEFLADNTSHTFYFNAIQVLPQQSWQLSDGHDGSFTTDVSITKNVPKFFMNETTTNATTLGDLEFQLNGTTITRIVNSVGGPSNALVGAMDFRVDATTGGNDTSMITLRGFDDTVELKENVEVDKALTVTGATTLNGGLSVTGNVSLPADSINATEMAENSVAERALAVTGTAGTVGQVLSLANTSTGEFRWIDDAHGDENIVYRTHASASSTLPSTQTQANFASNVAASAEVQTFQSNGVHGNLTVGGFNHWIKTGDTTATESYTETLNLGVSSFAIQGPTSGTYTLQPVVQDSTDGTDFPSALSGATIHTGPVHGATYGVDTTHQFGTLSYSTTEGRPYRRLVWRLASLEEAVVKTYYGPHAPLLITDTANSYSNTDLVIQADPELHHDYIMRNTAANEFTLVEQKNPAILSVDTADSILELDNAGRLSAGIADLPTSPVTTVVNTSRVPVVHDTLSVPTNIALNNVDYLERVNDFGTVRFVEGDGTSLSVPALPQADSLAASTTATPTHVVVQTTRFSGDHLTTNGTSVQRNGYAYAAQIFGSSGNPFNSTWFNDADIDYNVPTTEQRLVLHHFGANWFIGKLVRFGARVDVLTATVNSGSVTGDLFYYDYEIIAGQGNVFPDNSAIYVTANSTTIAGNLDANDIANVTTGIESEALWRTIGDVQNLHTSSVTLAGLGVSATPSNITNTNLVGNLKANGSNLGSAITTTALPSYGFLMFNDTTNTISEATQGVAAGGIATAFATAPDSSQTGRILPSWFAQAGATNNQGLVWNGSAWGPADLAMPPTLVNTFADLPATSTFTTADEGRVYIIKGVAPSSVPGFDGSVLSGGTSTTANIVSNSNTGGLAANMWVFSNQVDRTGQLALQSGPFPAPGGPNIFIIGHSSTVGGLTNSGWTSNTTSIANRPSRVLFDLLGTPASTFFASSTNTQQNATGFATMRFSATQWITFELIHWIREGGFTQDNTRIYLEIRVIASQGNYPNSNTSGVAAFNAVSTALPNATNVLSGAVKTRRLFVGRSGTNDTTGQGFSYFESATAVVTA